VTASLARPLSAHFDAMPAPWRAAAAPFLASPALEALCRFVDQRIAQGATVYPPRPLAALDLRHARRLHRAAFRRLIAGQGGFGLEGLSVAHRTRVLTSS